MAEDRIHLNIAHLSPDVDLEHAEAVHPVGASHLREYLDIMYGEVYPKDPSDKILVDNVIGALAIYSTNDEMPQHEKDPIGYIPHWLKYLTPVVDRTKALGKRVDEMLTGTEQKVEEVDNDLAVVLGTFDVASFVVAESLALGHPRYSYTDLMERANGVLLPGQRPISEPDIKEVLSFRLLIELPILRVGYRKKLRQLQLTGQRIIEQTESNVERLRTVLEVD